MDQSEPNAHVPAPAKKGRISRTGVIVAVVAVLLVLGAAFAWKMALTPNLVKKDQYQAVFLTNGQVYFGKLQSGGPQFLKLEDVYYLQTNQDPQKTDSNKTDGTNQTQTLIRLGKEIHGPDNEMVISRDQVLFFENISNNGTVGKAIQSDKQKK
jgi:cytochrome c biogenesis protein ResB